MSPITVLSCLLLLVGNGLLPQWFFFTERLPTFGAHFHEKNGTLFVS
jgi:hypothetical protein